MSFADEARIFVKAGSGGGGSRSFRREKFVPLGGPDGGDGGRGGDVILQGDRNLRELSALQHRRRFLAEGGRDGRGARQHGRRGKDLKVDVPLGTVVWCRGELVGEVTRHRERLGVARGGKGGLGNVHFATPARQAPRFAQRGEPGEGRWLDLDLRLLGDVGLVGQPNVGKSSLLAAMTAARPEIADYPFTTLTPNLGVVELEETRFVVVDIPGLIAGAHAGAGLGHGFLRHVQRARLLVQVVDTSVEDPWAGYEAVQLELERFDPALVEGPQLVALNKVDLEGARARAVQIQRRLAAQGREAHLVSALTGEGTQELAVALRLRLEAVPPTAGAQQAPARVYRLYPQEALAVAVKEGEAYRVVGSRAERLVAMADMGSEDGLAHLQRELERVGVFKVLREAGVQAGDIVRIAEFELEWV